MLSGRRVLVSTGTRPLQDQIFYKDLPALAAALGTPIKAAYMKGRTNYLCLHRFERLREAEAGLTVPDRRWLTAIAEWATETVTGDRGEIEDLPDDLPLWSEVTATTEQCLGRECPRYTECFVTRMKDRAAEASVVIVNHHLLCADASVRQGGFGEVIPDCDVAVIDEAHQLEDVVTSTSASPSARTVWRSSRATPHRRPDRSPATPDGWRPAWRRRPRTCSRPAAACSMRRDSNCASSRRRGIA